MDINITLTLCLHCDIKIWLPCPNILRAYIISEKLRLSL